MDQFTITFPHSYHIHVSKQTFISRFSLIIKRLERGPAPFSELKDYLENESDIQDKNFSLSIRTLQRDIKHIYEQNI